MDPLFTKALRDLRGQVIGWSVVLALLLVIIIVLYPLVADLYASVPFPPELMAFFGASADLGTIGGWLAIEFFSYAHLVLSVFAILAGTAALIGDESDGTLDLLLAQPVARGRLVIVRALALALGLATVCIILFGATAGSAALAGVALDLGPLAIALASLWLFSFATGMAAMALSVLTGDRRTAGTLVAVVLVASYLLESMANILDQLEPLRPFLVTTYYEGVAALTATPTWTGFAVLAALSVLSTVVTLLLFDRRDLGVTGQWLSRLRRGPAAPAAPPGP